MNKGMNGGGQVSKEEQKVMKRKRRMEGRGVMKKLLEHTHT